MMRNEKICTVYNRPYDVVYTNFVGTIVYDDDWQITVSVADGKMV